MAGTVVFQSDKLFFDKAGEATAREVAVLNTADAAANTYPDTNLVSLPGLVHGNLTGWGLWMIETKPEATGPTDNTDYYLKTAGGTDLLGGSGLNAVANAANNLIYPPASPMPIGDTLTQSISGNSVNSGAFVATLYLVR